MTSAFRKKITRMPESFHTVLLLRLAWTNTTWQDRNSDAGQMSARTVDGMHTLPRHLWEAILLLLKPPDIGNVRILSLEDCQDVMLAQAEYARLRLVCSQCNEIYKLQKLRSLSLFKECEGEALCSLLAWLHCHRDSLQSLETTCGGASLDLILGAVAACPLKLIDVGNVEDATLQSVISCRLLTSCAITIDVPILDIMPLQGLPRLTNLLLQGGRFVNFQVLVHLTSLYLLGARVESASDSPCASKLSNLELHHASIAQFHHCGLSACQGLKISCLWEQLHVGRYCYRQALLHT